MRRFPILACVTVVASLLTAGAAQAGAVSTIYRTGAPSVSFSLLTITTYGESRVQSWPL